MFGLRRGGPGSSATSRPGRRRCASGQSRGSRARPPTSCVAWLGLGLGLGSGLGLGLGFGLGLGLLVDGRVQLPLNVAELVRLRGHGDLDLRRFGGDVAEIWVRYRGDQGVGLRLGLELGLRLGLGLGLG